MTERPAYQNLLREGERVISADNRPIGIVDQVRGLDFVLDRYGMGELRVPFDAILEKENDQVKLKVRADQVDLQGWIAI